LPPTTTSCGWPHPDRGFFVALLGVALGQRLGMKMKLRRARPFAASFKLATSGLNLGNLQTGVGVGSGAE
jgi:hypothetical protein